MKILITEQQLTKIVKEVNYISKDELNNKIDEDKLDINILGIYSIKDIFDFYSLPPFRTLKRFKTSDQRFADSSVEAGWKRVTEKYPVVVVDIPFDTARQKNYTNPFYKNARNKETFSHSDNNIYTIFVNTGNGWKAEKFWLRKGNNDAYNIFKKYLIGTNPFNFIEHLTKLTKNYKIYDPKDALDKLISILSNIPKTNPNDLFDTDDDIDREFREPIRFTLRNGQDPKPIVDKIIKKYGRLSKDIKRMVNGNGPQVLKHPRQNPYLD